MDSKLIELQQQVRNNSDELQDFLRDLGSWTKQMELKDEQLKSKKTTKKFEAPRSVEELKRKPNLGMLNVFVIIFSAKIQNLLSWVTENNEAKVCKREYYQFT